MVNAQRCNIQLIWFDRRTFLDEAEWLTYCKRKPVRYIRTVKAAFCQVCGLPGSPENPLQNAHLIGFDVGVIDLGMTPKFLDSDRDIVSAHRRTCNKQPELDLRWFFPIRSEPFHDLPRGRSSCTWPIQSRTGRRARRMCHGFNARTSPCRIGIDDYKATGSGRAGRVGGSPPRVGRPLWKIPRRSHLA